AEQVQLVDVFPTLLELAGSETPVTAGHSLLTVINRTAPSRPALSEIVGSQYGLRDAGFKLIAFSDGRVQLFDLESDPQELHDIATEQPARIRSMRAILNRTLANAIEQGRHLDAESVPVDPGVTERLRALGYMQR